MMTLEAAVSRILDSMPAPGAEVLPLAHAGGRFLAQDVVAPIALPVFDNTAMDGYAVRSPDVRGASQSNPVPLRVTGTVSAGETFSGEVGPGTAVRVFTGSPMPRGADAVVMQEESRPGRAGPDVVEILGAASPGQFVRKRGEEMQPGATVGQAGSRLTPALLGWIASIGIAEVHVGRVPSVGVLTTGSELAAPGSPLRPGQIYDSNRVMLAAWAAQTGAAVEWLPLVPDSLESTKHALEKALEAHDVVLSSGGVSVGGADFIKPAFEAIGGHIELWQIAMKPGKPFVFGSRNGRFLFGLPGNPASSAVTFLMLARPALIRMQGGKDTRLPSHPGVLLEPVTNVGDRRHFLRVNSGPDGGVRSAGLQGSHALGSLAAANGLLDTPPHSTLPAGTRVTVLRID
jgi:molybdopterin molybdotransferase